MPTVEVHANYHYPSRVEQSFRMGKSDLQCRPIFPRQRDSIEAHLTVVLTSPAIASFFQNVTGLSLKRIFTTSGPIQSALIQASDHT